MKAELAAAAAGALLLAGCGSSGGAPKAAPGPFAVSVVQRIVHNRYGAAWGDLLSADRKVAGHDEYVACESRHPVAAVPRALRVLRVSDESVGLGDGTFVKSTAVAVRITFAGDLAITHTVHLVAESGHWRFILPPWRYRDYKANRCPSSTPPANAA